MAMSPGQQQLGVEVPQQRPPQEQWRLWPVIIHSPMLHLCFTINTLLAKIWQIVCIVTCWCNMTIIPIVFNLLVTSPGEIMALFSPSTVDTRPATGTYIFRTAIVKFGKERACMVYVGAC